MELNSLIFKATNSLSGNWDALDFIAIFFAEYLVYIILVVVVVGIYINRGNSPMRNVYGAALTGAIIASWIIKPLILLVLQNPRPFIAISGIQPLIEPPLGENLASFPSGHALFTFAIAAAVHAYNKKLGTVFYIAAILIGLARIYVGVHWPVDILAGAGLGILAGWVVAKMYKVGVKRG